MIIYKSSLCGFACKFFVLALILEFHLVCGVDRYQAKLVPPALNCSEYCQCMHFDIQEVFHHHYQSHVAVPGIKYENEAKYYERYTSFLGIYSLVVGTIIEITCEIKDGRNPLVSSLLNGIEHLKYTSLRITCRSGEKIIWDIPAWQVSLNIFETSKCSLIPDNESKGIVIPMNMWIFDVDNVGDTRLDQIDIRYTINTLLLSISGTDTFTIPDKWKGDSMISIDRLNLRSNKLKRFECKFQFTNKLDTLNLFGNELSKFPECLMSENYQNIRFLLLSSNHISDISYLWDKGPFRNTIEVIDLSHNVITKIGRFSRMKDLSVLDLSHNQITHINDDAFNMLSDLKRLFLQNNRIQYIGPVAFRDNRRLTELNLQANLIKFSRTEQFSSHGHIKIDFRKNKFITPPFMNEVERKHLPPNFSVLSANNPFHCDCKMIAFEECFFSSDKGKVNVSEAKEFFTDLNQMKCSSPRSLKGINIMDISYLSKCFVVDDCPESCACTLVQKNTFIVNCTASRLLEMPETIPIYPNATTVLDLSHNPLQLLGYRWYLANLSDFYVDNCLITSITPAAVAALENVKTLRLHNNLLQRLPLQMKNITLKNAVNISLHNNRWSCSCDTLWLPQWIRAHRGVIWKPGSIKCNHLKKSVDDFNSKDVSCEPYAAKDIALALSLIVSSLLSTFLVFFYYNKDIKLILYSKFGIRLCSSFSYGDQFSPYDVFVSYGQDNYKWVVDTLVPQLEEEPNNYKLCLHYRDFPADESTVANIPWAIRLSKCSLLILSEEFMKKEWCIMELRAIFQRLLMAAHKLIIITTDNVSPEDLTPDLCAYMNTHEYLKIDEPRFWEKLGMLLPPRNSPSDVSSLITAQDYYHDGSGDTEMQEDPPREGCIDKQIEGELSFLSVKNDPSFGMYNSTSSLTKERDTDEKK